MAALEHRVITGILRERDMSAAISAGLVPDEFKDGESRQIYKFIYRWWHSAKTAKTVPTVAAVRKKWPSFEPTARNEDEDGALKSLIHELRMRSHESDIRGLAEYFMELVEEDPEAAIGPLKRRLDDLDYRMGGGAPTSMLGIVEHALQHYEDAQHGDIYGVPWPWEPLTQDTLGKLPEQFVVFYGRMKSMKCVVEGQRIMMSNGALVPIEEVPEETSVPSYTDKSGRIRTAKAKRVTSGTKDCVEVTTQSGLRLSTSTEHLYMVPGGGYERICDLEPGDYVATARTVPEWKPDPDSIIPENANLLGLLVGDGNYTRTEVQFTTADEQVLAALWSHVRRFWGCSINTCTRPIEYRIVGEGKGHSNPILNLLRNEGIHGQKSSQKRVPVRLFSSSIDAIEEFLAGYLDTDGTVGDKFVAWSSSSRELLLDVQHLLMRFGVRGRLKQVVTNYGTAAYQLYVYSKENATVLDKRIGPRLHLEYKREALSRLANRDVKGKRNVDAIPETVELLDTILQEKGEHLWPRTGSSKYNKGKLFGQKGRISRQWLNTLAEAFDSDKLRHAANTEIIWERIDTIEPIGKRPCYDILIEDGQDPNFVVEGLIVHNTWLLLYCAVMDYLLYDQRVIIWSREMDERQLSLRIASILCGVDYQLLKKGRLPPRITKKTIDTLKKIERDRLKSAANTDLTDAANTADIIILSGPNAPKTIDELRGALHTYQPSVLYVDSFYHLHTERVSSNTRWVQIAALAEDLKLMAIDFQIPLIGTTQANREGEKKMGSDLTEVADADNIAREADLIIRVIKRKGRPLYEEEYEVAAEQAEKEEADVEKKARKPKLKLRSRRKKKKKKKKKSGPREDNSPRVGAEIALILGGNRDGVLEAFTIHAIPGYNFKVIDASFSSSEVKRWVEEDNKKMQKEQKGEQVQQFSPKTFKGTRDKSEAMDREWKSKEKR